MSEELFDVVNERDEVIDRRPRSEVHRLGLLHRAVHVLVFNPEGKLFLQKRSAQKDRHPQTWDSSASGHLDSGEDYDHAAVRELREELGWSASAPLRRILRLEPCGETDQEFVWVYLCEGEGPFQLHPDEIECGGWFSKDEITRWINDRPQDFTPVVPLIWTRLQITQQASSVTSPL